LADPLYRPGDFVWSAFPERENPARPGPGHIGYIALTTSTDQGDAVFLAYTTSQQWSGRAPSGVYAYDRDTAAGMGHSRPFTLDLRRLAALPVTAEWFPDIAIPNRGVVGKAPERVRMELEVVMKSLFRRCPEIIERLGPLWSGTQR
jgi:hypothetical protein